MDPIKKNNELKDYAAKIIEWAKAAGADESFVSASHVVASRMSYEKNDFNIATHHEGTGFGITVHTDNKSGSASINTLDDDKIKTTIERALQMAKFSVEDEYLSFAPKAEYIKLPDTFDENIVSMSMATLREMTEAFIAEIKTDERVSLDNASFDRSYGSRVIANSNGMVAEDNSTSLSWSLMGMAIAGEDITSFDYLGDFSNFLEPAKAKAVQTSRRLKEKLVACLGAKSGVSYLGKVLLTPSLVEEFLVDPLVYHLQGSNIMDGKSRFAESLEQQVACEALSIEDHPHDDELRGSTAFSGEGVPTQKMTLVENGVLKKQVDSIYSANRRGATPTGNGGGPHCAVVPEGSHDLKSLRETSGDLLEVGRFSGNVDPISGDFSGVAKSSHLYKNGEHQGPVKETMISGNIFEILKQSMQLENLQHTEGGNFRIPHALIDGVSVTAG